MKPQCTTAAECLRELARVMDQFGIDSIFNAVNSKYVRHGCGNFGCERLPQFIKPEQWQFAIAEVEGKPVFIGDKLWNVPNNFKFVANYIKEQHEGLSIWSNVTNSVGQSGGLVSDMSWNPPKPKTVMVEILVEDARYVANTGAISLPMVAACKKALEKA